MRSLNLAASFMLCSTLSWLGRSALLRLVLLPCLPNCRMLLLAFFIMARSIYRGLLSYLILNGWLSVLLVAGLLLANPLFLIFAILGKVGYYPFFLLLSLLYCCASYAFIIFDLLNKLSYFACFSMILNVYVDESGWDLWLILCNLAVVLFFIKFIVSAKHILFVSSYIAFTLVYWFLVVHDLLYSLSALLFYLLFTISLAVHLLTIEQSAFNRLSCFWLAVFIIALMSMLQKPNETLLREPWLLKGFGWVSGWRFVVCLFSGLFLKAGCDHNIQDSFTLL